MLISVLLVSKFSQNLMKNLFDLVENWAKNNLFNYGTFAMIALLRTQCSGPQMEKGLDTSKAVSSNFYSCANLCFLHAVLIFFFAFFMQFLTFLLVFERFRIFVHIFCVLIFNAWSGVSVSFFRLCCELP